jgi:hypothetical protein
VLLCQNLPNPNQGSHPTSTSRNHTTHPSPQSLHQNEPTTEICCHPVLVVTHDRSLQEPKTGYAITAAHSSINNRKQPRHHPLTNLETPPTLKLQRDEPIEIPTLINTGALVCCASEDHGREMHTSSSGLLNQIGELGV